MRALRSALLLLVLVAPAAGDVVVLKDGRKIEGEVVRRTATEVVVRTAAGEVSFPAAGVAEVLEQKTREEEYRDRLEACQSGEDFYRLGLWCREARLPQRAAKLFARAIEIDPDHAGARQELGFVRHDGEWMTPAERDRRVAAATAAAMQEKGFVLHDGRWVTPEEKAHLEKGEVQHEGRWIPKAEAMRLQGLAEFAGEWLPIPEARAREAAAGAAATAGTPLEFHIDSLALVCGTIPAEELAAIGAGIGAGRAWFDAEWLVPPGRGLFGGLLAEFYVFAEDEPYLRTIPYLAARSFHIPRGWAEAVSRTHGFVWTDPIAISSARQRGRNRTDLVGQCYHHLGHLMLNRLGFEGTLLPPWYDEGVAALTELHCHGQNAVFCRSGAGGGEGSASGRIGVAFDWNVFRDGTWRSRLAREVREGRLEPFDKLARREFGQLELLDIAAAMAIVEWLDSQGAGTLLRFHRGLRTGAPRAPLRVLADGRARQEYFDRAFRLAVGLDHRQADEAWRRWLLNR
ncbi:MAG: hypothetical protein AB1726_07190 [Planctomycetota bacterium]